MPNKHAAEKDLRKNRRHAKANSRMKTNVKALYSKGMALIKEGKKSEAKEAAKAFQKAVDKASKNGVVSKNASRRKKASLMKNLGAMKA